MNRTKKFFLTVLAVAGVIAAGSALYLKKEAQTAYYDTSYAMSTIITQTAYGAGAEKAMGQVAAALREFEDRLSLFSDKSEIAKINDKAGVPVQVSKDTYELVKRSLELSASSQGAFDVTIAPLTLLWGITTDHPAIPAQQDIAKALALVDDSAVVLDDAENTVCLAEGQAIDLGGIAKGNACSLAKEIYEKNQISSAVLSIGGNVYIRGRAPDGSRFKVGFRDPYGTESSYIATIELEDEVLAVSGGYERYFEENGVKYCHILSGQTGWPVESDIVSVGVISPDGTVADFMSTTLFVWGEAKTKEYMAQNPELAVVLLNEKGEIFVSKKQEGSFALTQEAAQQYTLYYI